MTLETTQTNMQNLQMSMVCGIVRVVATKSAAAWVESDNQSACGGCSMAKGCGTKVISGYFSKDIGPLKMVNDFDGVVGDRIEVGIYNTTILKVSALIYLIPLVGLITGAILGDALGGGDITSMAFGAIGFTLGFYFSKSLYSSKHFAASIVPVFLKKLKPAQKIENSCPSGASQ